MDDRDEADDSAAKAEAFARAREVIAQVSEHLVPLLDARVPVGRGDDEDAILPNSIRLVAMLFDAADARDLLEREHISQTTIRRMLRGEPTMRSVQPAIDAIVSALVTQARGQGRTAADVAEIKDTLPKTLLLAAERWDALVQVIGDAVRIETAAALVLRVVAIDVGIRLGAIQRATGVEVRPWFLFEPRPLRHAIDAEVLPRLGLDLGDVQHWSAVIREGTPKWARSTLAGWRDDVIPESAALDDFANDLAAIAAKKAGRAIDAKVLDHAVRALRFGRAAASVRRAIGESLPRGTDERLLADFLAATALVASVTHQFATDDGLCLAWLGAQVLTAAEDTDLAKADPSTDEPVIKALIAAGLSREQVVGLVRSRTARLIVERDRDTIRAIRDATLRRLVLLGVGSDEAIAIAPLLARELPESGVRTTLEHLERDPRRPLMHEVAMLGFIEMIASRAGDRREAVLDAAARCAAILPAPGERT